MSEREKDGPLAPEGPDILQLSPGERSVLPVLSGALAEGVSEPDAEGAEAEGTETEAPGPETKEAPEKEAEEKDGPEVVLGRELLPPEPLCPARAALKTTISGTT
ncbi:MAG: hypothetical protein L3J37_05505 [Rhodobacteraceae bacterium]|nr:hypothetical protein [Paracoccaceae bacterium]